MHKIGSKSLFSCTQSQCCFSEYTFSTWMRTLALREKFTTHRHRSSLHLVRLPVNSSHHQLVTSDELTTSGPCDDLTVWRVGCGLTSLTKEPIYCISFMMCDSFFFFFLLDTAQTSISWRLQCRTVSKHIQQWRTFQAVVYYIQYNCTPTRY